MKNAPRNGLATAALLVFCAFSSSAPAWAAPEIAGGTMVRPGHPIAKTTVLLASKSEQGESLCSGSIIASDMVLTAAHCIADAQQVVVIFGTSAETAVHVTPAVKLLVPELYTTKGVFDIGLIRISGGLPAGYERAKLLNPKHVFKANDPIVVAGYGVTNMKTGVGSGYLRTVNEKIHPQNSAGSPEVILEHIGLTSICSGDSGGPAFVKVGQTYALFGVASRVMVPEKSANPCGEASVYTDIHHPGILAFIQDAMKYLRSL